MQTDHSFKRYQRQICLPEIGESGQQTICDSSVLIVGCGGLGNVAALYLAASGIGKLVLCDDDVVEVSNLHRQIAFQHKHITSSKVEVLASQLRALNPDCHVRTVERSMDEHVLPLEVAMADIVLDCSDNFSTRQLINRACFDAKVPLVSGAAIGWHGQVILLDFKQSPMDKYSGHKAGCYSCMVPSDYSDETRNCSDLGVIGPVVGTVGNFQALLTLQYLIDFDELSVNQLMKFDGKRLEWKKWTVIADPDCPVCGNSKVDHNHEKEATC